MSVEREIKQRLMENCNCQEFIYMGNTILIMELHSEDEFLAVTILGQPLFDLPLHGHG